MRLLVEDRIRLRAFHLWKAAGEPAGTAGQPGNAPGGKPDDVVEADYEIVDEDKK